MSSANPTDAPRLRRAVFFDRDGTLMHEEDYCRHPSQVRMIPGAGTALAALRARGWLSVIITNQSGIGRGYFTQAEYEAVNAELFRQMTISPDAVYFCPDHPDTPSIRRKPGAGMILEAARDYGINLSQSWMIGDKEIDLACGHAAGCRAILVLTGYGGKEPSHTADWVAHDVYEAVNHILGQSA